MYIVIAYLNFFIHIVTLWIWWSHTSNIKMHRYYVFDYLCGFKKYCNELLRIVVSFLSRCGKVNCKLWRKYTVKNKHNHALNNSNKEEIKVVQYHKVGKKGAEA